MAKPKKTATPVSQMSLPRLRAELVIAERQLHYHRKGVHGSCYQRCEDPFPCQVTKNAAGMLREVSLALAAHSDRLQRAELIEQARADWR